MSDAITALKEWARVAPPDDFWLWAILLLVAAIVGFFLAFKKHAQ
jgi:hypothetical protein